MVERIKSALKSKELDKLEDIKTEMLALTDKEIKTILLSIVNDGDFSWGDEEEDFNKDLLEFTRDKRFETYLREMLDVVTVKNKY